MHGQVFDRIHKSKAHRKRVREGEGEGGGVGSRCSTLRPEQMS